MKQGPELLAPAGHIESFFAAIENGADSIYLGLKNFSARASATNFTLEELSTLIPFAHHRNVLVYVAFNSAVTALEFPGILNTLQSLKDLNVDALIVQDAGVLFSVRKFFPELKLHGSTLMAVHNSAGVRQLERMGISRVVLARELSLQELEQVSASTTAELEIFVHGALCYSYSGLCLASSFRGGHSGLQGRCVQPCRLNFKQGRDEGYFLSCNDFCALPLLPKLRQLRLAAFKIEGRMKSADYIGRVVKSYRYVLDAQPGDEKAAIAQAQEWLAESPSRRLTTGFLGSNSIGEILTPHRSGSSGLWVGTVKGSRDGFAAIELRHELRSGDRLRPEGHRGEEMEAFNISEILSPDGVHLPTGKPGQRVFIPQRKGLSTGVRLFKIGSKSKAASDLWRLVRKNTPKALPFKTSYPGISLVWENWPVLGQKPTGPERSLFVKVASIKDLPKINSHSPQAVILAATRFNMEQLARQRLTPQQMQRFYWSIPNILTEKQLDYYRPAIQWFLQKGFRKWEINNWGHLEFFRNPEKLKLIAGFRFNLRNAAAIRSIAEAGCRLGILSLEITKEELEKLSTQAHFSAVPLIAVYAWPPIFTSRLIPKLSEDKYFTTPRKENLFIRKRGEHSHIYADRPINWFAQIPFLLSLGYRNFVLDFSDGPHDQLNKYDGLVSNFWASRPFEPYSLFNFDRRP